ncbi:hypothetical protein [Microcoleus sp. D2_18a_D3]|uniref:hypothetical protein n=1 Tax=Microcoleus sp. D2_18a_D3 TaxID=3055330 RepID=UPI002FD36F98
MGYSKGQCWLQKNLPIAEGKITHQPHRRDDLQNEGNDEGSTKLEFTKKLGLKPRPSLDGFN